MTKKKIGIIVLALLLIGLAAGAVWFFLQSGESEVIDPGTGEQQLTDPSDVTSMDDFSQYTGNRPIPQPTTSRSIAPIQPTDHVFGNRAASISFVQYSGLTDKYAKIMYPELKTYFEENTNANWVYRHYPNPDKPYDYPAAYVGECAWRQGGDDRFWAYLDRVFQDDVQSEEDLFSYVANLDQDSLELCVTQQFDKERIVLDKRNAQVTANFRTVPSFFFLNNDTGELRFMQGADTIAFIDAVIQEMQSE